MRSRLLIMLGLVACMGAGQGCAALPLLANGLSTAFSAASWVKSGAPAPETASLPSDPQSDAYRRGIRDALTASRARGGLPVIAMPDPPRVYWVGPVMEEVWMPAQIVGGLLIPSHRQWVVITPGYWQAGTLGGGPASAPGLSTPMLRPLGGRQGPY